jgi:hypothetical protein
MLEKQIMGDPVRAANEKPGVREKNRRGGVMDITVIGQRRAEMPMGISDSGVTSHRFIDAFSKTMGILDHAVS